jgi:hypothetical protein
MSEPTSSPTPGPYATAAPTYWAAGWRGILPLPAHTKGPVPKGYTGNAGIWPSFADVTAWTEDRPDGNIALRLPPDVLGIDVDAYDSKAGGLVLEALEAELGALPATWRTTSRNDGTSGIRLYRVPVGLRWPGVLGPGIETIRHEHRYAVVWPSQHPNGGTYRWITPEGATSLEAVPGINDLPDLPERWVQRYTGGEMATDQARADLDTSAVNKWVSERGLGLMCRHMASALDSGTASLTAGGARHDAALALTNRLVWITGEGHTGGAGALLEGRTAFLRAAAGARDGLEGEWDRMVEGAVKMAAAAFPTPSPDPCTDPFHGLISKEDNPWKTTPAPTTTPAATATTGTTKSEPAESPSSSAATADESKPKPDTRPRTTWWPRSIEHAISGENPEPPPAFLTRDDGAGLFYEGRVNGIIGPSESGKTWIALHAVKQAADAGRRITILDFEDSDRGIVERLRLTGMTGEDIHEWVRYINPDEPFHQLQPSGLDLLEHLDSWQPELIVLDGFNAAMTLQGLDLMSNKDATLFSQLVLKPLTRNDACVVYIDHVPKSKDNTAAGGIGAQAKRAMTTGCTLKVDPVKPFGKGQDGRLRVYVDKDRPGQVRGVSVASNGTHWVGDALITTGPDGGIYIELRKPDGFDVATNTYDFRPTVLMERISSWLADNPRAGRNEVLKGVSGNLWGKKTALETLIAEGFAMVEKDGQKHLHTLVKPFCEVSDLLPKEQLGSWGPTGVQLGSKDPGVLGSTGVTKDPSGQDPGSVRGYSPSQIVERTIAGERYRVNLDTGEMEPA